MITTKEGYDRLEYFSETVAADSRRKEFDIKNHTLIHRRMKPDFLFIGDSITHYWELNAYFNQPQMLIVNRGIGGDTTTYLNKRLWVDALQLHPKYCVIGIGINDSIDLEGDYWKRIPGRPYEDVIRRSQDNIEEILSQFTSAQTIPIITSLLPIHMPVSLCETERKRFVCDMNQYLQAICRHRKTVFVNYYPSMVVPGTNMLLEGITYDGIHPNAKGYNIMSTVLKNTLHNHNITI